MATFLDTLANQQDKELYLKQGFTYKIDIDQSLLMLAANQQRDQPFDQEEMISTTARTLQEVSCRSFPTLHTFLLADSSTT